MSFEAPFFQKKKIRLERLLDFGFERRQDSYLYRENFLDGQFEARIRITTDGNLFGQVIDRDLEEEYDAFRASTAQGTFIGQVREAYGRILKRIAKDCFEEQLFQEPQTNRLAHYLTKTFGDPTDNPFEKFPRFTAFRYPDNLKWYGLVGKVALEKLQLGDEQWPEEALQKEVEIINIKIQPEHLSNLLKLASVYPSYHMSKKSWVTIVLDERLPDERLFELVAESRALVTPKTLSNPNGPDYWVIPANPKYYDIDAEFAANSEILWTQKASIKAGDWVFIYMTSPIKAIRYACQVLETDIDNNGHRDHPNIKRVMTLSLKQTFSDEQLSFEILKNHSVKAIRGPRRLTKEMVDYLKKLIKIE